MATKKKVQISITVDEDQLKWMDKEIEENRFATRSHAIAYALTQLMKEDARR
jgi:Arc/MetJ-type ribon-helix-helix transcriptional regulator